MKLLGINLMKHYINQAQKTGEPLTIIQNGISFAIISPIQKRSLLQTLSTLESLNEDFADVGAGLLPLDDIEI